MQPNTDPKPTSPSSKTDNIATAIENAELLLQYVAESGIAIDKDDLSVVVDSKLSYRDGTLDAAAERLFWRAFTNVTHAVKPVATQSLKSIHQPSKESRKRAASDVDKAVSCYRALAVVSLFALLILQIYLIIGVTARTKLNELFEQKEIIKAKIEEVTTLEELTAKSAADDVNIRALRARYEEIEQKQDANYELLRGWNKIWLAFFLKDEFQRKA